MILVTGGTGILGSRLLFDLVSSGKEVRALSRSTNRSVVEKTFRIYAPENHETLLQKINWVTGDVTDILSLDEAMEGITKVYHCAGFVSFDRSDYKMMMKINVEGTENIVNICLEKGVEKLIHVSSIAAIGREKEEFLISEDTHWKTSSANSGYAISKYGAEREVWRGMEEGLNAAIVNPGVIIAPGDWHTNTPEMFLLAWRGLRFYTEGINAFVDARDVSKAMIALMESDITKERFIITSENLSFRDFFGMISDGLHKPRATIKVEKKLAGIGWRMLTLKSFFTNTKPLITKETALASVSRYFYSNEKIKKAISMEFIPMKQSVMDVCKVFLNDISNKKGAINSNKYNS